MIPSTTTITQTDELPGEEIAFSIGDPRWVMRTQADLYSNRELAVIREYSTNGADANLERALRLGIKAEPIQVTLPSSLNPYFVIRDFGDGMSRDVLAEVYTKFGESTKRDSNNFNGMLGYGCKSAVAYTSSFTVTSIYEGVKTIAVITRRPDWSIVMKIVSQVKTDEPSGTEVKVPVHNAGEFAEKARDFYKFWLPGTVTVNGTEPKHHAGRQIVDGLYASAEYGNSYVVMGNVPYRIENPQALFNGTKMRYFHFVAYVNNGDVEFTPSREALKYTHQTKAALRDIVVDLEAQVLKAATAEIEAAKTPAEAFTVWNDWRNAIGFGMFDDLTYKGEKLALTFDVNGYTRSLSQYGRGADRVSRFNIMDMPTSVVVTEFFIEPSSSVKNKVLEYAKLKGWTVNKVLLTHMKESDIKSKWIPRDKFVTWADLKAALPKKQRNAGPNSTGRPSGSWDYYEGYVQHIGQPIPTKGKLYWIGTSEFNRKHSAEIANVLGITDAIIIKVPANRVTKFKRDYPHIKNIREIAREKVVKDGSSLLCDKAKTALSLDYNVKRAVQRLDVSRLDDPRFKEVAEVIKNEDALLKKYRDNLALANSLGLRYHVEEYRPDAAYAFMRTDYPLVSIGYGGVHADVYIYINAKYKVLAEKEKTND